MTGATLACSTPALSLHVLYCSRILPRLANYTLKAHQQVYPPICLWGMAIITRLRVKNYLSLQDVDSEFGPRSSVLVGLDTYQ